MNNFLNKLERKFGRFAVSDLIRYMVVIYCLGAALGFASEKEIIDANFYYDYLALDMGEVFHGQVWRLFTYLLEPYGFGSGGSFVVNVLFFLIKVNLFFLFGRSLEQTWGSFRFNLYIFTGFVLNIIAALCMYLSPAHFGLYASGFEYIYWAMFFAFALYNPDMEFMLYFVLPIKAKWLAIADAVFLGYSIFDNVRNGIYCMSIADSDMRQILVEIYFSTAIAIVIALGNFLIFFFATRDYQRIRPREVKRRKDFKRQMRQGSQQGGGARHRCAICGRTELDAPGLDFRYCSKCEGNYEYCSEHLFTHQHVKKIH